MKLFEGVLTAKKRNSTKQTPKVVTLLPNDSEQPAQVSRKKVESTITPLALINIDDDNFNLRIERDSYGDSDVLPTQELYLDELAQIDELCGRIESDIADLAVT